MRRHHRPLLEVSGVVRDAVTSGAVTAAAALIGDAKRLLVEAAAGARHPRGGSMPTTSSLFDLASLAKPLTATLALRLAALAELPLETRLGDVWTRADDRLASLRLESLLRHRSGLVAWRPLYAQCANRREAVELLLSGQVLGGKRPLYSDLGYMLWTWSAEHALQESAQKLLRRHVLRPLGLVRDVKAAPVTGSRVVHCPLDNRRERELAAELGIALEAARPRRGEAQDGNARWCGAFCGHAGLFGSARALWCLAREWLSPSILPPELVERALAGTGRFRLGWWRRRVRGSGGPMLDPSAFGHTGFTGASLWIDPAGRRIYVFLAHRVSDRVSVDPWRHRLHLIG